MTTAPAPEPTNTPAHGDRPPHAGAPATLTRPQKTLIGIVAAAVLTIATLGFIGSYNAVTDLAEQKGFGAFATAFPIAIDAGIVAFLALDLLLTWLRMPYPMLRHGAWLLTAATIAFNAATAWPDKLGVGMHAVIPLLFVVAIEAARHAIGRIADITADKHLESPNASRWILNPLNTAILWRRQRLWGIRRWDTVLELERERRVYIAQLRRKHGRGWRRKATAEQLLVIRLAKNGMSVSEAIELPAQEEAKRREEADRIARRQQQAEDEHRREQDAYEREQKRLDDEARQRAEDERRARQREALKLQEEQDEAARRKRIADAEERARLAAIARQQQEAQAAAERQRRQQEIEDAARLAAEQKKAADAARARREAEEQARREAERKAEAARRAAEVRAAMANREPAANPEPRTANQTPANREPGHGEPRTTNRPNTNHEPRTANLTGTTANPGTANREPAANQTAPRTTNPANLTDRAAAKQNQVIAVVELIEELGFDATTLGVVMDRTGMSKTTAYHRLTEARRVWNQRKAA